MRRYCVRIGKAGDDTLEREMRARDSDGRRDAYRFPLILPISAVAE